MKRILIIEDNLEIRENTAEILELAGFEVITAENGTAGLEAATHLQPDLILCDIALPGLDGYEILKYLHNHIEFRHLQFIFLTAKAEGCDMIKGMELGADDYITKPFTEEELLSAIENRYKKEHSRKQS